MLTSYLTAEEKNSYLDSKDFSSDQVLRDDSIYHLRKNTFASFSLLSLLVLAISLSLIFYLQESNSFHRYQTLFGGFGWLIGQAALLMLLKHGASKPLVINLSLMLAAIILNSTAWASAGIIAIETPLLLLLPLIALSTLGRAAGLLWLFLVSGNIMSMAVAPSFGIEFSVPSFDFSWKIASGIFLVVFMSCAFGLIRILQLENKKLQSELSKLVVYHSVKSSYDGLTELLNKESFKDVFQRKITRAKFEHRSMTLLVIDLNKFKQINDNFGHPIGDEVLQGVACNLTLGLRAGDIAGRIGGDEFAILLDDVNLESDISSRIISLTNSIRKPIDTKVGPITVDAAIGYSVFAEDGDSFETLYEAADISMYERKHYGDFEMID